MEIRRLTPDLTDDYFRLFDDAFSDFPEWRGCFCAFYDDGWSEDWDPEQVARNRGYREAVIHRGGAHGLLAYEGNEPIGWVNAGPRASYGNLRIFSAAAGDDDPPTGSVMCFVIHPDHRGKGVASTLLAHVDDHLRDLGMQVAEGYPKPPGASTGDLPWTAAFYKGTPSMYEAAGYEPAAQHERFTVYRKRL